VNAQLIKKDPEEFIANQTEPATVHQTNHSGTENIVLSAQLELNSIQRKSNAITAQKVSSETTTVTPVFQDFDILRNHLFYSQKSIILSILPL
jgi:hypothetical protein